MTEGSGYVLETLQENGELTLYRARQGSYTFPLLVVALSAEQPSPQGVRRLEHEYSLAAELDPAWAAQPLEITRHKGRTVLVLKDPGGEPLDLVLNRICGHPLELTRFLEIAVGLAAAVGQVHRKGLIHKDIRPANVLVDDGNVRLTGFGIASRLSRERQSPEPPEFIAGTLAYMAPEQTGRMNRSIDSRSDLYALGITLYEMLTGSLPFSASDPMGWVHCHIARQPLPPANHAEVPGQLSVIIMKLISKNAEERYQTASGLEADLRRCLAEWKFHGRIDAFPLGKHDASDRLLIPEKLYGREREINTLLASFERVVARGIPELVLVSGYSGIGKSSVVNELHKVLVPPRSLFASGKFDQYKRDIPYATLAQAFQNLIRPLLSKSEAELRDWRDALREALGPNGLLIADLVPELKLILGEQPPVPELPPQDAQRRFQLVFRRFIAVFARPEHPLALFLDDLQWLDAATLDLLEDLLTRQDMQYLMLIGAYRDNEVDSAHPLIRRLEAIRKAGAPLREIILAPLACEDLGQLITDSLRCNPERVNPLAQLVHEKTAGNPFFVIQFISALGEEDLLVFDHDDARWNWDLDRICAKGYTDNVVDLLVGKLHRLPDETQKALQQLACMGNSAEFALLTIVYQDSKEDMHRDMEQAVSNGLVLRSERTYKFLHDRVQEAAYSLLPVEARGAAHLRIGRLLASRTAPAEIEENIFEIVSQLNRGSQFITLPEEEKRVAELNFIAGRRAKNSTAYSAALSYLGASRALLTEESWERNYELIFAIELDMAECELLTANMAAAETRLSMLAERATRIPDIAAVARLRLTLYTTLNRSDRCVEVCIDYLQRNGTRWSAHPTSDEVRREYDRIWFQLGNRSIEDLIELPLMDDPYSLAALDVLTEAVTPALFTDQNLLALVICHMVNLSLENGNCEGSCFAYVGLGVMAGPYFNNYKAGFRFGRLGYELVEKRGLKRFLARTYMTFGNMVMPWTRHIRMGRDLVHRAFDAANKIGDLTFAAYSCNNLNTNLLAAGDPLDEAQKEAEHGLEFAQKARFGLVIDMITLQLGLIRTLRGLTPKFGSFIDGGLDECQLEERLSSEPGSALPECWYWIRKLQARFFAGDYASAVNASLRAQRLLWTSPSFFETAEYHFYSALCHAAACDSALPEQRGQHWDALIAHHRQLEVWAENCPENFANRVSLVAAEIARLEGRALDAMHLYEHAIQSAREHGFVQNEGLAHELAAQFYLVRGLETASQAYLRNARNCYDRWGALGKVRQLDVRYPHLREERTPGSVSATAGTPVGQLDIETVVKASQALSSEIVLHKLIEKLMRIAVEHAGAERGLLILLRGDQPYIEAEASTGPRGADVTVRQMAIIPSDLLQSALHYVIRTQERVVLDDASVKNFYSEDEYVRHRHPRSVLCLPVIKQTNLVGALYLENNLTPRAFTADRVAVLELLASQAAISLENARLYSDVRRNEDRLRSVIDTIPAHVWSTTPDGSVDFINQRLMESTGLSTDDLLGWGWGRAVHPDDLATYIGEWHAALAAGKSMDSETRIRMADGSYRWLLVRNVPLRDEMGNIIKWYGTGIEIEDRKRAEEKLHQAQTDLAHVNRVTTMGELTASLAHEVKQPIAAVVNDAETCLSWLNRHQPDIEGARDAASNVVEEANRAAEIINRIGLLFKKGAAQQESVDLNEAIGEIIALLRSETMRYFISARTELAADLPEVAGDRVQLQQVLMNLIMNSIDAMKDMDGKRDLVIKSEHTANGRLQVCISDTGVGLPHLHGDQIFNAFFTTKPHGTGMGLRISRSIVESHNGCLWASDNFPRGAKFFFTLPAQGETVKKDSGRSHSARP